MINWSGVLAQIKHHIKRQQRSGITVAIIAHDESGNVIEYKLATRGLRGVQLLLALAEPVATAREMFNDSNSD